MVLGTLINHPELLSRDTLYELRNIVARYPYFQTARLLMLNNMYLLHDPDFGAELRRSVLYVNDRRALCRLIEGYVDRVVDAPVEIAEEPTVDRTMSLIDAFLGTLPEERTADSLLPIETVGDYATMFLSGDDTPVPSNSGMSEPVSESKDVDSVLRALSLMSERGTEIGTAVPTESSMASPSENAGDSLDESYFTETLAKIYIKQHKSLGWCYLCNRL